MVLFDNKMDSRLPPFTPGCICVKSYDKNKNKTRLCSKIVAELPDGEH